MEKPFTDDTFLARWLAGELSPQEQAELEARDDFAQFRQIANVSQQLRAPVYDQTTAWEQLQQRKSTPPKRRLLWPRYAAFGAAASVLLLVLAYFLLWSSNVIETDVGQTLTHQLPDGSSVVLRENTTLRYHRFNWWANRQLELLGEGFFDVAPGNDFVVQTEQGSITVIGTEFNVLSRSGRFAVDCYEGQVRVTSSGTAATLREGTRTELLKGKLVTRPTYQISGPIWKNRVLEFKAAPLAEVIRQIEAHSSISVVIPDVPDLQYTGPFDLDAPEKAVDILCLSLDLNCTFTNNVLRISLESN